jgi:hypothetical protein
VTTTATDLRRPKLGRRAFLALGGALPALPSIPRLPARPAAPAAGKLFLFVDWHHVKKGDLKAVLDPRRVSAEGRQARERFAAEFNLTFEEGEHGFQPLDVPHGVRITPEPAEMSKAWLVPDRPWEKMLAWTTVLRDEGRYRCWTQTILEGQRTKLTVDAGRAMEVSGNALGYAESTDGWNWTKPSLRLYSWGGSLDNNLVSPDGNSASVFRDDHGPAEERYKMTHFDALPREAGADKPQYGLYGLTSPDGYRWKRNPKPLIHYFSDTENVIAWDPLLAKYVGYFRHHTSGRTIARAETDDFWNWPPLAPLFYPGPMDSPADDYYTNGYTVYPDDPSLRLLFASIYHHDSDGADVRLAVSREGRSYQWLSYEPIIRVGEAGAWNGAQIYPGPNLVHLPDGRLALPVRGHDTSHNEHWFQTFYASYPRGSGIGWALWKDGRLAGIEAAHLGGLTIKPARFDGSRIEINARTARSGSVQVELREQAAPGSSRRDAAPGRALDGFAFADCVPFRGDQVWSECRWKNGPDLSGLRGKNLEMAVRLSGAKLFAARWV